MWGRAGRSGLYLVVPTTSFWGVLTNLSLSLPPFVDAMESSYAQAEYNEIMSSHVTLRPEAILSSSSQIMASFTPFLDRDKSGVTQRPKEVKKKEKSTNMLKSRVFPRRPILFPYTHTFPLLLCPTVLGYTRVGSLLEFWSVCWLFSQRKCLFVYMGEREA